MSGTNDDSCEMAVERMGMLGVSVRMMKTACEDGDSGTD
jgi:hypothetical protein